ncbi:MAG TPA: 2Fe-2S iron-sulfur cluster-binding protein [Anaerolineae bacterium]|nr:2Fe-2S iron-sulfur cluster-binding protein [Anaerolineae bacterium]
MPTLTIDGQAITVPTDSTVLQAIRTIGAHLPTLCYWEGLPPYGACRLCLVEMTAPRQQVIAACAYPVEDNMAIETHGTRAVAIRKMMLEFLLARCPTSEVIRSLAAETGVTATHFTSEARPAELCVLCGLCVRVCRDLVGAAAIGFSGRGADRKVGAPFQLQAEACIGCGACAAVCPTGAIEIEEVDGQRVLHTWNTHVPLQPCPGCGQPFAPEPMVFLRELVEASERLWGLCPTCRRRQAAAQFQPSGSA